MTLVQTRGVALLCLALIPRLQCRGRTGGSSSSESERGVTPLCVHRSQCHPRHKRLFHRVPSWGRGGGLYLRNQPRLRGPRQPRPNTPCGARK